MSTMNWYKGNIAEAVAESKVKNAVFVVFVEGQDDSTKKLIAIINETNIRTKLESDDFVAIKIESTSQAYMQFASIYQAVPVPSIFFIGKSGTPLEIGTAVLASATELEEKINKVLAASGKPLSSAAASSSSFIAGEQHQQATNVAAPAKKEEPPLATTSKKDEKEEVVCEGGVCFKKPKEADTPPAANAANEANGGDVSEERLTETRKLLEEKRRARVEEEKREEKEAELRRREDGKQMQNLKEWQKEQELKELKDNLRRDRLEEQAARDRIRAQIAADRAERANKNAVNAANASSSTPPEVPKAAVSNADSARIQFRFSNGDTKTHSFGSQQTLEEVRTYVKAELLPGTGIRDFTLATTYPKRVFAAEHEAQTLINLELCPTAVILVIGKESAVSPSAILARSGGLVNMITTVFWAMLSPVFAIAGYLRNMVGGGGGGGAGTTGAQKRANEEDGAKNDAAKRRNLDRFGGGSSGVTASGNASGSSPNSNDPKPYRRYAGGSNVHRLNDGNKNSDDENATWNGNSTQQQ